MGGSILETVMPWEQWEDISLSELGRQSRERERERDLYTTYMTLVISAFLKAAYEVSTGMSIKIISLS